MEDSAKQAVLVIIQLGVLTIIIIIIPLSFGWAYTGFKVMYKGLKQAGTNIAKLTGKAGKKAAMNTKYGQAAQQFMGERKAIAALKGKEFKRQQMNKNPWMASLMGGPGGGDIANRFLDKENRAKRAEEVGIVQRNVTGSLANAIGNREDINKAMKTGKWAPDASGKQRAVSDEDRAGYEKLTQQGYINPQTGEVKKDAVLATAAMQSIMRTELATDQNVRGIAGLLQGAGKEENAQFTDDLRTEAAAKSYKNFSGASVTDGVVSKFFAKTGELETGNAAADRDTRLKGAKAVINSSIRGINKDALDKGMDNDFLEAIKDTYANDLTKRTVTVNGVQMTAQQSPQVAAQLQNDYIVKIAEQTGHIDKDSTLQQVVNQFGGAVTLNEFKAVQQSIKSGGAVQMPTRFTSSAPPAPGPVVTPPPAPPASGTLNIPHGQPSAFPAQTGTLSPPPPQPPRPPSNRPPSGPGPQGGGGTGPGRRPGP